MTTLHRRTQPTARPDTPPLILTGEYRAPQHDNTELKTIAARIARQCAANARAAKVKAKTAKTK